MAKQGFSYYKAETDRFQDIKIKRLKKKYRCAGYAVYQYVLNEIYRVRGYCLTFTEDHLFDVSEYWDIEEEEVTAIIGGGGKTTLMETLAGELSKKGKVIITTTTHICRPKQYETLLDADEAAVSAALERSGIVCVASQAESGKLCAPWLSMGTLAQLADFVLVEADGAKRLPLKAHASHEPVIPEEAQRVIMVIGIDGVGKTIRETCHRSALYAQLAGVDEETVVTPQLAARIVNAEGYGDRVYINKVESAADYEAAQAMANEFSCPVIAGSLHQGVYVCLH